MHERTDKDSAERSDELPEASFCSREAKPAAAAATCAMVGTMAAVMATTVAAAAAYLILGQGKGHVCGGATMMWFMKAGKTANFAATLAHSQL